jgi:hypothetical protein
MAVADNNVGPRRQIPAATARRARRSSLARLLLQLPELPQLDRKLPVLLLLAASLTPACIIPVGPDWQDPVGRPNQKPTILSTTPPVGSRVTTATFTVELSDPDDEMLSVKWFADFPPFVQQVSTVDENPIANPNPGSLVTAPKTFFCVTGLSANLTTHQIMAAISDRPFIEGDDVDPLATTDGVMPIQLVWTLDKACQGQQAP